MNIFIYGGRRSGKTEEAIKWINSFNLPVVFDGPYHKYEIFKHRTKGNAFQHREGLSKFVRVYEDLDTLRADEYIKNDGQEHTIITCTPDNHKQDIITRAYEFYLQAIKNKWAIVHLGFNEDIKKSIDFINPNYVQGQIYGEWHDSDLENLKELAWKYTNCH